MAILNYLKNRYEIIFFVIAQMCNPNGDPDMGNAPRMDYETGRGIITDVAFKSRMRRYIQDAFAGIPGFEILIRDETSINKCIAEAVLAVNETDKIAKEGNKKVTDAAAWMAEKYWDVRTFGAVMSTGLNAGQIRGAVQVGMSLSTDPIQTSDITITRCAYTNGNFDSLDKYDEADEKMPTDKKRTMGRKQFTPFAIYPVKMTVSANIAEKVGFTEEDFQKLLESVVQMYNNDASSSKMGMSVLTPVIVFKHVGTQDDKTSEQNAREAKLGCASSQQLFDLVKINKKSDVEFPRSIDDYDIYIDAAKLPNGVDCGLKTSPYGDIEWLTRDTDTVIIK